MPDSTDPKPGIHPDIIKLGLVSFLTDLSSEIIFSVFAIFSWAYLGEKLTWQHGIGFAFIALGAWFIFQGRG